MENENKDWKPEVGKTAWYFCGMTNKRVFCATVLSLDENEQVGKTAIVDGPVDGNRLLNVRYLYPSMEAALASIKIYDLEGKEVVIPRARPIFDGKHLHRFLRDEADQHEPWIDKLKKGWEVFEAYKASKGAQKPWDEVESRALRIMFTDEAGMLNYSWEQCLAMARREIGAGAAIGGKSDQREGGC